MPRTKVEKKKILEKVEHIVKDAASLAFVNFHGLKVSDTMEVRRQLRKEGVSFFVAKKSLTRKALENSKNISGSMPELPGELGIAYGSDLLAPAREVYAFEKKFKGGIALLGGIFEGTFMNKEEMTGIAVIPSEQTLRAMFVNVINSPIQGFVMALSEIAKKKTA